MGVGKTGVGETGVGEMGIPQADVRREPQVLCKLILPHKMLNWKNSFNLNGVRVCLVAAIPLPLLFCTSALIQNKEENNGQALNGITTAEGSAVGSHGQFGEARRRNTINIASLNAKNVKTNINFIKYLSESIHVIFFQETWLYRFQVNVVTAIFENTEFSCGCVDDHAPLAPIYT